jgi:hypothetical protein
MPKEALGQQLGHGLDAGNGPGEAPMALAGGDHAAAGRDHFWGAILARFADAMTEVAGAEEEHVDTLDGGDLVDLLHRLRILDLADDEALAVGGRHVLVG